MAITLGIDPGSRVTGFGVIEIGNGRANYLASGCVGRHSLPPWA